MSVSDENQNPLLRIAKWTEGSHNGGEDREDPTPSVAKTLQKKKKNAAFRRDVKNNNNTCDFVAEEFLDPDVQCGFTNCMKPPKWLQRLTTKRTFLLVFCVSSVLQGMYYTYFVSVLTTIERLFQIRSQTTGVIMSATEVGQIGGGLLLSYYGGGGHRPRWIASGMLLFGFSASLCALPHFLFGDTLLKEFLASAPSQDNPIKTANVCFESETTTREYILETVHNTTFKDSNTFENETCENPNTNSRVVLGLFFVALLGVGVGQTAVYNLGIPYIDDNVASEESPTYFGTTIGVRIFGPTFGFVLGSLCTRLSVDPFSKPKFEPTDPRWIGAWWLGHLIISSCLILMSFIMMMFPKRLPHTNPKHIVKNSRTSNGNFSSINSETFEDISPLTEESLSLDSSSFLRSAKSPSRPSSVEIIYDNRDINSLKLNPSSILDAPSLAQDRNETTKDFGEFKKKTTRWIQNTGKRSIKDFLSVVRRLVTNQILVLRTASSVLHLLPIAGLYTFLPKYIETQFRLPVHSAAMISGVGGILVMGFGIFVSGFVIRRLNPPPKAISGWIAITAFLYSLGMIILMFLGCSHDDVQGRVEENGTSYFRPLCERSCTSCNDDAFAPICSTEGKTYFSACHAGCRSISFINSTEEMFFADCDCLGKNVTAKLRLCETLCPNLMWYVGVFCLFVIIHSTSEVGGMLVTLRCVSPEDKAMALGLISVAVGLFGNVPCPILYGAVIDYACIHWRESCDGRGACQIYDSDIFRKFFHGTTAFVMFLAFCVDVCVWHYCKDISFATSNDAAPAANDPSPFQSNPPSTTLTIDRNDIESIISESKREKNDEVDDGGQSKIQNGFDKAQENSLLFGKDNQTHTLQLDYDVTNYPLRESII